MLRQDQVRRLVGGLSAPQRLHGFGACRNLGIRPQDRRRVPGQSDQKLSSTEFRPRAPDPQRRPQRECHDAGTDLLFLEHDAPELQPEPESLGGAREDGARQLDVLRYALCRHGRLLESRQHLCHARYRRQAVSRAELLFQGVRPHGQGQCPPGGRPAGRLSGRPAEVHRVLGRKCGRTGDCKELGEKRFGGRKPHGFEFFPSVPAAVKAQKDAASWGL